MAESEVRTIRVVITLEGSTISGVSADVDGDVSADVDEDDSGSVSTSAANKSKKKSAYIRTQLMKYGKKAALSAVNVADSYYNLEENYKANIDMQNARSLITDGVSIAKTIYIGAQIGGWAGAAVGAVAGTGSVAFGIGKSYISEAERLVEMAYSKRYKSEALGLIDGSRGTEN